MLDDRPYMRPASFRQGRSAVVILLITNAVAFVLQLTLQYYSNFSVGHYLALSLEGLRHGYIWQLFTFQFLHAGWLHLLLNCWAIYVFGRELEETLGRTSFWILYFASGILGGVTQVVAGLVLGSSYAGAVMGASAGAFGLVAAYAAIAPERSITLLLFFILPVTIKAKFLLLFSAAIAVLGIVFPGDNVAHAAHLGGMLGGLLFIRYAAQWQLPRWSFRFPRPRSRRPVLSVHSSANKPWSRGQTVDLEELPPAEFLSREVDPILDKISAQGIQSLTDRERRILEKARSKVAQR